MKNLIFILFAFLLSSVANATGGWLCKDQSGQFQVSATTGRTLGSPIVSPLRVRAGDVGFEVSLNQIVQYKQNDKTLYVLGLDPEFMFAAIEIETYVNAEGVLKGKMVTQYVDKSGTRVMVSNPVVCEIE